MEKHDSHVIKYWIEKVNSGCKDLRGADLAKVNLAGTDLTGADLAGADLRNIVSFCDTVFDNTKISHKDGYGLLTLEIIENRSAE